jgi:hypothetical protein
VKGGISLVRDVIQHLVDDIDDGGAPQTVRLSYRGIDYEVDLSARSVAALDDALAPYLDAARPVPTIRSSRGTKKRVSSGAASPKEVRAWARGHGIDVSDRGRLSVDVNRRYRQAHGG